MAMLILSVWSQYSWLPCGHALRMGLDMNLHRALDNLADGGGEVERSDVEERDLGKSGLLEVAHRSCVRSHLVKYISP